MRFTLVLLIFATFVFPAKAQDHPLYLNAGEAASFVLTYQSLLLKIDVISPANAVIFESSPTTTAGKIEGILVANLTGLYHLRVSASEAFKGTFSLTFSPTRLATEQDRRHAEVQDLLRTSNEPLAALSKSAELLASQPVLLIAILNQQANLHMRQGDMRKAREVVERMEKIAGAPPELRLHYLATAAVIANNVSQFDRARKLNLEALAISRKLGDQIAEAHILYSLGNSATYQGKAAEAIKLYEEALELGRKIGHFNVVSTVLNNLAARYNTAGKHQVAAELYDEALSIQRKLGDQSAQATTLFNLSNTQFRQGNLQAALELAHQSLDIAQGIASQAKVGHAQMLIGSIQKTIGIPEAIESLRSACEIFSKIKERNLHAECSRRLSAAFYNEGKLELARQLLHTAVATHREIRSELLASSLLDLATVYYGQGETEKTVTLVKEVLSIPPTKHEEARALLLLGRASKAKEHFQAALVLSREIGNQIREMEALYELANVEAPNLALPLIEQAIFLLETSRQQLTDFRAEFRHHWSEYYELWVKTLVENHRLEEALEAVEKSRARELLDLIQATSLPLSIPEIKSQIGNSTLLEYSLGDHQSYLFVVNEGRVQVVSLPPRKQIEQSIRSYLDLFDQFAEIPNNLTVTQRQTIIDSLNREAERKSKELAHLLLPVTVKGSLLISPDGPLNYIPFGALLSSQVTIVPSISTLAAIRKREYRSTETLAVLADPEAKSKAVTAARNTSSRLPFARSEARSLMKIIPSGSLFLGAEADRAKLSKIFSYRYVHFATHGTPSGLLLSDGPVGIKEISAIRLSAEMVTLSGCETAKGRELKGEGIVGISCAFLHAGSKRILAALWKVDDAATAEFMKIFYRHVLIDQMAPSAALKATQDRMKKSRWPSPYYWAGFVLQGEK